MADSPERSMAFLSIFFLLFLVPSHSKLERFQHSPKPDGSLSFLVVGDFGRKGRYNQSEVSVQMGKIGEQLGIDFVISTGDNFYDDGLKGIFDPAFYESFSDIYTAPSLRMQWYLVLGNHDYRGDVLAQLSPVLRRLDKRFFCKRSFILKSEIVDLFFVDTTPFVTKYFTDPKDHIYDWRGVLPRKRYITNLLRDVDWALEESRARWKIVVAHHPIRSAAHHGNTEELESTLLPILEANGVDLYINGHDHCLQHISSSRSGIQFLTSGGGSKAWRGDVNWWDPEEMKMFYDGQGFMSVQILPSQVRVVFYDVFGKILHDWTSSKQSYAFDM